jgi:D-3-phosphoglycerate dehydrogenase
MKILIAEQIAQPGIEMLRAEGWIVDVTPTDACSELQKIIGDYDALIVRSRTRVSASVIEAASRLKVIGRAGAGVDNIDVDAATRRGILVMNTPGGNSISVAEHTFGLMLCLMRHIVAADASLKRGEWEKKRFIGNELRGKTLGLIGLGKIGQEVARRARAFGMQVLAHDPFISERVARDFEVALVELDELYARSDIISLHATLTKATRGMIGQNAIARMKDGVILINCARGELVEEKALLEGLNSGKIAGAGLDVFAPEPPTHLELVRHPRVVATPHVAASTVEAQQQVGIDIAAQVREYLRSGIITHAVNFPAITGEEFHRLRPFLLLGEMLGSFVAQAGRVRVSEIGIRYYGELNHLTVYPISNAVVCGVLSHTLGEEVNLINARAKAGERQIEVIETRSTRPRSYANLISIQLRDGKGGIDWVEGTILHQGSLRLVSVNGVDLEIPLAPYMLVVRNEDVPGVIGRIGTILGDAQVNIGNFALAPERGEAIGILTVDSPLSDEVLAAIRSVPAVKDAKFVTLSSALSVPGIIISS